MDKQPGMPFLQKDPEILKFQRALQDQALAYLIETREPEFWNVYRQELSKQGNLLFKDGKESDKRPAHLILDLEMYKELVRKTKEALAKTPE